MIELSIEVSGASEVVARLDRMTDSIRARLEALFVDVGGDLRGAITAAAPIGNAEHDKHPGKLRKSIKAKVTEKQDSIALRVGPPVFYGRFLEKGVPEQTITVKRRGKLGRGIVGVRSRLTKGGVALISPKRGVIEVGKGATYTRRHHITAHPFFQPAFDSMRGRIMAGITEAVRAGVEG